MIGLVYFLSYSLLIIIVSGAISLENPRKRPRIFDSYIDDEPETSGLEICVSETVVPRLNSQKNILSVLRSRNDMKIDQVVSNHFINLDLWSLAIQSKKYFALKHVLTIHSNDHGFQREIFFKAIQHGAVSLVKFMIEKFTELKSESYPFVVEAALNNRFDFLKYFALNGFDPNCRGYCMLHRAAEFGNVELMEVLLKFPNINIDCLDSSLNTPLHISKSLEISRLLIKHGASHLKVNSLQICAVDLAAKRGQRDFVVLFLPSLASRLNYFVDSYVASIEGSYYNEYIIFISRQMILEDSFKLLDCKCEWYRRFTTIRSFRFKFKYEHGVDQGGLTREWFSLVIERFFVPKLVEHKIPSNVYNLDQFYGSAFECIDSENMIFRVSSKFTGPPAVYKFIGSIMAKALLMNIPLKAKLACSIYKLILGEFLTFEDLKVDDPLFHKTLSALLNSGYDFELGSHYMPNDLSVLVTSQTAIQFIEETALHEMYLKYKDQLDQLRMGFHSIIEPRILKAYFNAKDLQTICNGDSKVDLEQLQEKVSLIGLHWKNHSRTFWDSIKALEDGELVRLINFITGVRGIPFGGILNLPKHIKIYDSQNEYVKASTCNFSLSLPTHITTVPDLVECIRLTLSTDWDFNSS